MELPYVGEKLIMDRITGNVSIDNFVARLYSNSRTPAKGDTISEYTEVNTGGYSEVEILPGDWTISYSSGTTTMTATVTFTFTSSVVQIYGFYITNNAGTSLFHAEEFSDSPVSIGGGGGSEDVTISIEFN